MTDYCITWKGGKGSPMSGKRRIHIYGGKKSVEEAKKEIREDGGHDIKVKVEKE